MWTRGEARVHHNSWRDRAFSVLSRLRGAAEHSTTVVYQRVLLAYRTKDENLHLKLFKNVEDDKLELLLPNIDISMSDFDRYVLTGSLAVAAATTGWRMVSSLSSNGIVSPITGAAAAIVATAGLIVLRLWGGISNNRNRYLVRWTAGEGRQTNRFRPDCELGEHSILWSMDLPSFSTQAEHNRMLYFHNISDNRGVLALMMDRATVGGHFGRRLAL
jgi:hypothetical protein